MRSGHEADPPGSGLPGWRPGLGPVNDVDHEWQHQGSADADEARAVVIEAQRDGDNIDIGEVLCQSETQQRGADDIEQEQNGWKNHGILFRHVDPQ